TQRVRSESARLLCLPGALALLVIAIVVWCLWAAGTPHWPEVLLAAELVIAFGIGLVSIALPLAVVRRVVYRSLLRRRLAGLPSLQAAEVLLPLREERLADTRKLVGALARDLRVPTELTPASAPTGSGDEASPAI